MSGKVVSGGDIDVELEDARLEVVGVAVGPDSPESSRNPADGDTAVVIVTNTVRMVVVSIITVDIGIVTSKVVVMIARLAHWQISVIDFRLNTLPMVLTSFDTGNVCRLLR